MGLFPRLVFRWNDGESARASTRETTLGMLRLCFQPTLRGPFTTIEACAQRCLEEKGEYSMSGKRVEYTWTDAFELGPRRLRRCQPLWKSMLPLLHGSTQWVQVAARFDYSRQCRNVPRDMRRCPSRLSVRASSDYKLGISLTPYHVRTVPSYREGLAKCQRFFPDVQTSPDSPQKDGEISKSWCAVTGASLPQSVGHLKRSSLYRHVYVG
jgi:hypothetical protein